MADSRQLTGTLLAFDKHMNVVLADTEEFRRIKRKPAKAASSQTPTVSEEKRTLGLIILRGLHIVSLSVEGPPPADPSTRLGAAPTGGPAAGPGPGIARPAGRGLPIIGMGGPPPPGGLPTQMGGLQGPMRNVGLGQGPPGGPPGPPAQFPVGFPGGAPPGFQPPPPGFQPPGGRGFPPPPPGYQGRS